MFAQIVHLEGTPEKIPEAIRTFYLETIPAAGEQAGFSGGYLLADRATGRLSCFTKWASEAEMVSGERAMRSATSDLMRVAGASGEPAMERFEVVGEASGNLTARPG